MLRLMPVNLHASGTLILIGSIVSADDGDCGMKGIGTPLGTGCDNRVTSNTSAFLTARLSDISPANAT